MEHSIEGKREEREEREEREKREKHTPLPPPCHRFSRMRSICIRPGRPGSEGGGAWQSYTQERALFRVCIIGR